MRRVRRQILFNESASHRAGGKSLVVALEATPFSKMIRKVECRWCWGRVFVVDEAHRLNGPRLCRILGMDNDITTEEVAVSEDQLSRLVPEAE